MNKIDINFSKVPSPAYVVDERLIIKNLEILKNVMDRTRCRILLAQKAFSMFSLYPLIGQYLSGTAASSLFEARLGYEEMKGKEVHIYSPAYREEEFDEIMNFCDHIIFNSFSQWNKYKDKIKNSEKKIECGLRINPEYSEIKTEIYNPCAKGSRLGITLKNFKEDELDGIDGLHFHTMCEQNSDVLERTIKIVDEKFGKYLKKMKWINLGGGHHITRPDYDIETLIKVIISLKEKYDLEVYLEPGEAIALNAGYLVTRVLDIINNEIDIAILDTSAACHMPDVIEMPYRPNIIGAGKPGEYPYTYRLGGVTCLAGDIIGDYSFKKPLKIGDILVFTDMAIYTMVKNNTFNGINLPSIVNYNDKDGIKIIRQFGYEDFKSRLS
ncbi:carboxynorspermidine decarboxylase [Defluviitalea phaphyphila]|uniref:carboxynorspermidine decarboxylase n=1 Tax=Defluviitalea phaphyphila TaxID=1473580 RepID=UPI0007317713|nr:carboxynorspermidine decarboxylase [Defluviitalea phaphyphila]